VDWMWERPGVISRYIWIPKSDSSVGCPQMGESQCELVADASCSVGIKQQVVAEEAVDFLIVFSGKSRKQRRF
jgi:hypothetical protein